MHYRKLIKIVSVLVLCFILVGNMQSLALTYSPGPIEYKMDVNCALSQNNVIINENSIVFGNGGGMAEFDVLLPFDSDSLTITYTLPNANPVRLSVDSDNYSYSKTLATGSISQIIDITETGGSNTIAFTADGAVTITGIKFGKVNEKYNEYNTNNLPLSEYEYALLTSVVVKSGIPVIKTRGAVHHLNIENVKLTPFNLEGRLYVPFKKLAESLGYYSEDYPDKSYIYMTGETDSLALMGGEGYIESDKGGRHDLRLNVLYRYGITWVPVRALCEALGFTVEYRDGYVVIDDRLTAKNVVENEAIFASLKQEFSEYALKEEQEGKIYHVSQKSNTESLGTEKAPFKTIAEAAALAKAGDTVIIHEGTYREELKPKYSGTASSPITFRAAEGENVVISALEKISGFTTYQGNILSVNVAKDLGFGRNQLFYKGAALVEGRHPNKDTKPDVSSYPENISPFYATRGNMRITAEGGNVVESPTDLDQPESNYWKGATYVTLKGEGWSLASGEVISSSNGQLTVKDHDGTKSYNLGLVSSPAHNGAYYYKKVHESDYGYLTNHINTLDVPGEWYMKNNTLYMIKPDGADLNADFEIKQRQRVIDLRNKQYITIKDISTIGGGVTMDGDATKGCILNGGTHKYIAHHTILLDQSKYSMTSGEDYNSMQSLKSGEAGFFVGGQNNVVVNATIDHSSATGITLVGKYHYINNNNISNTSYSGGYPGGIYVTVDSSKGESIKSTVSGGHFITSNTVFNSGRSVILMGSSYEDEALAVTPIEIAYNRFFNGSLTSRDTGVTYEYAFTGGNDKARTRMHHNFIYNPGYKDNDTGHNLFLLYQDGYVASRDTYCNVTYYQEKDKAPSEQVFEQDTKFTVLRCRNNAELEYLENGEFDIERTDFPGERPFLPGSNHGALARRYMENYENFENGIKSNVPAGVETNETAKTKTFTFENVHIESEKGTLLTVDFGREANKVASFNITAKVYKSNGEYVTEASMVNKSQNDRFYVKNTYKGIVVLPHIETGNYIVKIEFPDLYTEAYRLRAKEINTEYDSLFTPEMESDGIVPYYPAKSEENSWTGTETVTFENVYIEGGKNVLLNLHMLREYDKETEVELTANVYDSNGSSVGSAKLLNKLEHALENIYEPLSGIVVVPNVKKSGNYKVTIKLSDTYSDAIRLLATPASSEYDSLFNEDVFLGGTYNRWINKGGGGKIFKDITLSPEDIKNYNYLSVSNTWNHTIVYSDRNIKENANTLRVTSATDRLYEGSEVSIYVDSLNSDPLATWTIYDSEWKPKTVYVPLNRELQAGKHTFYFVYNNNEMGHSSCSTLYNFSFINTINGDNIVQDFEKLSEKTYTKSNANDFIKDAGLTLRLDGTTSAVTVEKESNNNKILKYTSSKNGDSLNLTYELSEPIKTGLIEASFSLDCTRKDSSAWQMFSCHSANDGSEDGGLEYQSGNFRGANSSGTYKRTPSVNPDTGRYHLSATISRINPDDDWTVMIFDDYSGGLGKQVSYVTTIPAKTHPSISDIILINCYPVAVGGFGTIDDVSVSVFRNDN